MDTAASHSSDCHPRVAADCADIIQRYARLDSACNALESFLGVRPRDDDDIYATLSLRRTEAADVLSMANLEAHQTDAAPGVYLAVPFFPQCSTVQLLLLINLVGYT